MFKIVVLSNIEKAILIDEKIKRVIDKIQYVENNQLSVLVDGIQKNSEEYLQLLYNELMMLGNEANNLKEFFGTLGEDVLYDAYSYLAGTPKDNLKMAKIEYLIRLINNVNDKERER